MQQERLLALVMPTVQLHIYTDKRLLSDQNPLLDLMSWLHLKQAPYYTENLLPILKQNKVMYFTHADSRLANNDLPDSIQRLRCRVNYRSLKYAEPIRRLAHTLIDRMKEDSPYIALHLRYSFYLPLLLALMEIIFNFWLTTVRSRLSAVKHALIS